MRSVSSWFKTEMDKQTLHPLRRFKYNGTDYRIYVNDYGATLLDAKQITAGAVTLGLINTDKTWNMFLSDISNLRKEGVVDFALGMPNTIARAGMARAGITVSDLYTIPSDFESDYLGLELDGSGYASIADAIQVGLDMGLSDFMVEMRIKLSVLVANQANPLPRVFSKATASTGYHCYIERAAEVLWFGYLDGVGQAHAGCSSDYIDDLQWHNLTLIIDRSDATGIKIYIDRVEVTYSQQDDPTTRTGSADSGTGFVVGDRYDFLRPLQGSFNELRVWNFGVDGLPADYADYISWRYSNPYDSTSNYNGGSWNTYVTNNLSAHYKFNGNYTDETSNSNDLTAGGTGNTFVFDTHSATGIYVPRAGEWIKFFTGLGDEPRFEGAYLNLQLRDKMAKMLEKKVGSGQGPVDYYTASYNPADLVWDLLTTHGGLDSTASTANTDIDYTLWSDWKTDCTSLSLSLEAKLEGEYIGTVLEKVAYLTHTVIFIRGDGKFAFYRYSPPAGTVYTFDDDNTHNQEVKQTFDELLNDIRCYYDYDQALETWAGSVTADDATSQTSYGKVSHTEEDTSVWHATEGSAQDYCNRRINRFKDPRQFCNFDTGIMGFVIEPGDLVNNDIDFWGYVSDVFEVRKLDFDLNVGKTRIEMLNVNFYQLGGFLLDDAYWGLLDEAYNPLF